MFCPLTANTYFTGEDTEFIFGEGVEWGQVSSSLKITVIESDLPQCKRKQCAITSY